MKSRPTYPGLAWAPSAARHLIVAEGEGALAVADLFARAPDGVAARAEILYTAAGSAGTDHVATLTALGARLVHTFPSIETLLFRLNVDLGRADMGLRLAATGTEGFIGRVVALAQGFGIDPATVTTEHRGSLARRVQCVHCKGMTEGVTTSIVTCSHCGLSLFVRDHFSKRLGAFQGVIIDAEEPGVVPEPEVLYP